MKKLLAALLCALLLCGNAWAEGDFAVFQDQVSVALDTEYVNLGDVKADMDLVGSLAAEVVSEAIIRAVEAAESAYGFPCQKDVMKY